MLATAVYLLCGLTSAACAVALIRTYVRQRTRLLLWSSLSFAGLAVSNALVVVDFVMLPRFDLAIFRAATACVAVALLLVGFVWEAE